MCEKQHNKHYQATCVLYTLGTFASVTMQNQWSKLHMLNMSWLIMCVSHNPFAHICVCYLAQSSRVLGLSVGLPSVRKHTACRLGLVLFSSGFLPLCPVLSVFNLWLMNVLSTRCEAASLWNVLHSEDCMLNHVRPRGQDLVQNTWMTFSYHFKPTDPTHTHMHR